MQISRHWRIKPQRYRLEGVRYENGEISLQPRPVPPAFGPQQEPRREVVFVGPGYTRGAGMPVDNGHNGNGHIGVERDDLMHTLNPETGTISQERAV